MCNGSSALAPEADEFRWQSMTGKGATTKALPASLFYKALLPAAAASAGLNWGWDAFMIPFFLCE